MLLQFVFVGLFLRALAMRGGDSEYQQIQNEIEAHRKKLLLEPRNAAAWGELGMMLQAKDIRYHENHSEMKEEALECFDRALEFSNEVALDIQVGHRKGMLLKMMGLGKEAIEAHDLVASLSNSPADKAVSYTNKAHALGMLGRVEESVKEYRKSIKLDPKQLNIYLPLVQAYRELSVDSDKWQKLYKEIKKKMENRNNLGSQSPPSMQRSLLTDGVADTSSGVYWALFLVAEKLKDYSNAWAYLEEAHLVERNNRPPPMSSEELTSQAQRIKDIFIKGFWPVPSVGINSSVPIFIVGMMRSGSTLLETMLDAHHEVWGMGEDSVFNANLDSFRNDIVGAGNNMKKTRKVASKHGQQIVSKMLDLASSSDGDKDIKHVVDKMLFNYRNIGFIHLAFPNAIILHTMRDPMDTLLSCLKHKFDDGGLEWALDEDALALVYYLYLDTMEHFRRELPGRVIDVRYEELVLDTERTIRSVLHQAGVDWDPNVLEFHTTKRIVHTHSMSQVRHGINTKAIGGWRKYAKEVKPLIRKMKKYLNILEDTYGGFPFEDEMNWSLNPNFQYPSSYPNPVEEPAQTPTGRRDGAGSTKRRRRRSKVDASDKKGQKKRVNGGQKRNKGKNGGKRKKRPVESEEMPKKRRKGGKNDKNVKRRKKSHRRKAEADAPIDYSSRLMALRSKFEGISTPERIAAVVDSFSAADSNGPLIDSLIAIGYLLVNNRRFLDCVELLGVVVEVQGASIPARMALGTAYAQLQQYDLAIEQFTACLDLRPNFSDALNRRGEVFNVLGDQDRALQDYSTLLEGNINKLDSNLLASTYHARGGIYYRQQYFSKARKDLYTSAKLKQDAAVWSLIGKTEKEFANTDAAVHAQEQAMALQPNNWEAVIDKAIVILEVSRWEEATELLTSVTKENPRAKLAYGYLGLMYISMGRPQDALDNFYPVLKIDPMDKTVKQMAGICLIGVCEFKKSVAMFDDLLSNDDTHFAYYNREIALYLWMVLDMPVDSYYPDRQIDTRIYEGLSQQIDHNKHIDLQKGYKVLRDDAAVMKALKKDRSTFEMSDAARYVMNMTMYLSSWIQLKSPGFLPNTRQHKMFGIAVLQMAQQLRRHVRTISRDPSSSGVWVRDIAASSRIYPNDFSYRDHFRRNTRPDEWDRSDHSSMHPLGWRDLMDIMVRWRQASEPRDLVLWIDRLPIAQSGSLGLTTNIIHANYKNIRYWPYQPMGLNLTRREIVAGNMIDEFDRDVKLTPKQIADASKSTTMKELYKAVGSRSIYVNAPCLSRSVPGLVVNGTRLILKKNPKEGYDFSISSPSTIERFAHFEVELEHVFNKIITGLGAHMQTSDALAGLSSDSNQDSKSRKELEAVLAEQELVVIKLALEFFFYWVHFAPLSRGTSATGYGVFLSFILAMGEDLHDSMPPLKQLDFEGMFRKSPDDFVDAVLPWLTNRSKSSRISTAWLDGGDSSVDPTDASGGDGTSTAELDADGSLVSAAPQMLSEIFRTSRDMISIFL